MRRKGITLIELVVAISLMALVIGISANLITVSSRAQAVTLDEYEVQSSVRIASEATNTIVRYSSAIFTVPKGRFFEGNLTAGWSYFGASPDGKEIIRYVYETRDGESKHWKEVVVPEKQGLLYEMIFEQAHVENDKIVKYTIEGTLNGGLHPKYNVQSEIEAVNALQVVDRGTATVPAVAIAYRSDERPQNTIVGNITMVMDVSGSMVDKLNGNSGHPSRISLLKSAIKDTLIEGFSKEEAIELCLVPFSTSANYYKGPEPLTPLDYTGSFPLTLYGDHMHPFYTASVEAEKQEMKRVVDALRAEGGTNTGDGMRRAYYRNMALRQLIDDDPQYSQWATTRDYMIILVDGVTTFGSLDQPRRGSYQKAIEELAKKSDDGPIRWWQGYDYWNNIVNYYQYYGQGNESGDETDAYVDQIGQMIKDAGITVYVIGFSSVSSELASVDKIAVAAGAKPENVFKFDAGTLDLNRVFAEIKQDIMSDLWHIRGPQQ